MTHQKYNEMYISFNVNISIVYFISYYYIIHYVILYYIFDFILEKFNLIRHEIRAYRRNRVHIKRLNSGTYETCDFTEKICFLS